MAEPIAIPPLDKLNIVGIWIETVLFGINIILFAACILVLSTKRTSLRSQLMLIITSVALFILATMHVGASLRQLLDAFVITPQSVPGGSILYWLDNRTPSAIIKNEIYCIIVWIQDIVLIWRMYVVYGNNWKICVAPFVLDIFHIGAAIAATVLLTKPGATVFTKNVHDWALTGWALDLAINIGVTGAIVIRLWWMGRKVGGMTSTLTWGTRNINKYSATIFTIVESGGIFAASTLALVVLYLTGNIAALTGLNVATQLAATTPFLIVVRVGLGITHGVPRRPAYTATSQPSTAFSDSVNSRRKNEGINITREFVTDSNLSGPYPLDEMKHGLTLPRSSHSLEESDTRV